MPPKYKIAWDYRRVLGANETTDQDGFASAKFGYCDGTTEVVEVRGPIQALSHGFKKMGERGYARVFVYETRDGELRILAEADETK